MRKATTRELMRLLSPERLQDAAKDVYTPRALEEIRCWFCGRSPVQVWDGGLWRCATSGACRRFYASAGVSPRSNFSRYRCKGYKCRCPERGSVFRLRAGSPSGAYTLGRAVSGLCCRCGYSAELTFPTDRIALLTSVEDRVMLRGRGYLAPLPVGGPTGAGPRRNGPSSLLPRIRQAYVPLPDPPVPQEPPPDRFAVRERWRERAMSAWVTRREHNPMAGQLLSAQGRAARRAKKAPSVWDQDPDPDARRFFGQ